MILTVAWVHPYSGYHNNWVFEPGRDRDLATYKWQYLRAYLAERQIDLQTFDVLDRQGRQVDVYLFDNLYPSSLRYILRRGVRRHQRMLLASETKIRLGRWPRRRFMWRFLDSFANFFPVVLTYDPRLIDGVRFRKQLLPQPFLESHRQFWAKEKTRFATMIVGNKRSAGHNELYSIRRTLIQFFEEQHPEAFDLYGTGWNQPQSLFEKFFRNRAFTTSLYRGICDSKLDILADYKFTFCPDNHEHVDYIDEKLFDALFAGSVPVYIGAPNVDDHIPETCFVSWERAQSLPELYDRLAAIAGCGDLATMRQSGWDFLTGDRFEPFSIEHFSDAIYQAITELRP